MKSPLFKTLNNYFRIFRYYQKTKRKRKGKENLRKRQIDKIQELKEKKRKIQLEKQKELEGIEEEIYELIKVRLIYI